MPAGKAFGFNSDVHPPDQPASSTRTLDAAVAAGVSHMRMGINWRAYDSDTKVTQPIPPSFAKPIGQPTGNPETDRVDKLYGELTLRGIKPVLMIHNAPIWASTFHPCVENPIVALDKTKCPKDWKTAAVFYTAVDRQDGLRAFVSAVVRRYPDAVIEGTNEPDYWSRTQPQYQPKVSVIASDQCALADAVHVTDPSRKVLSPGFFYLDYVRDVIAYTGQNHRCWDDFSFHIAGSTEVRGGPASGTADQLDQLRYVLGPGKRIFITETGISNTVTYNNDQFQQDALVTGEPLVARAWPRWLDFFLQQPDIDGVLIDTIRQETPGTTGDQLGFGLLNPDFTVKDPGPGIIPRFCYLVLSSGNSYPGCGGYTLPGPPAPSAPTFFKSPALIWGANTGTGDTPRVLFFEEGTPLPNVNITWYRCNAAGLGCQAVFLNKSVYKIQPNDRLNRLKVSVTAFNSNGAITGTTVLSPVITH